MFTHNDGLVDARYLAKVPASTAQIGQLLTITEELCHQAIADTEALCRALALTHGTKRLDALKTAASAAAAPDRG